jgi:hydroxymethylbilane synthase
MEPIRTTFRIGTRGSLLARAQTQWVVEQLHTLYHELAFVVEIIQTTGDLRRDVPFNQVGTKGMFVKEIEQALLDDEIDIGVHSLKDMPAELPEDLILACYPQREDARDALISRDGATLLNLPQGSVVGTSSIRRRVQLQAARPDLDIRELRGNLDTRLRKLDEGEYDAIVLACAGLNRLGFADRITERLSVEICVPAVGQGALGLETRRDDPETLMRLEALHDADTSDCVLAERAFLMELQGGCSVPAGAWASLTDAGELSIMGVYASDAGKLRRETLSGSREDGAEMGQELARKLRR